MKVLVFGFDALEYNLVEKFKLDAIKQKRYCKLEIPKECYTTTYDFHGNEIYEPWTPYVWSSFLTGKTPQELGLDRTVMTKREGKFVQRIRSFVIKHDLESLWMKITKNIPNLQKMLRTFGGKKKQSALNAFHLGKLVEKCEVISFPMLTKNWMLSGLDRLDEKQWLSAYWHQFLNLKKQLLEVVTDDWDLLLFYTRLADVVGELRLGVPKEMLRCYFQLNSLVYEISNVLKDTCIIVVSDHGIEKFHGKYGKHSNYAFFSTNVDTTLPKNMLDCYRVIQSCIRM